PVTGSRSGPSLTRHSVWMPPRVKSPRRPGSFLWLLELRVKRLERIWDWCFSRGDPSAALTVAERGAAFAEAPHAAKIVTERALRTARLALLSHNNCLITDRPDLPRSAETGWTTDFSRELQLLDEAIGSTNTCPRSSGGSSGPLTAPL